MSVYLKATLNLFEAALEAQGPHSHILMTPGEGGRTSNFLGSEMLSKDYFLGSMKDAGIFWVAKKPRRDCFGLRKKNQRIFWGMLKKVVIFLGRQILKL